MYKTCRFDKFALGMSVWKTIGVVASCILLASCGAKPVTFVSGQREAVIGALQGVHGTDSLARLQERFESGGDHLGSIIALREWGTALRKESRFEEALEVHRKGLRQAEAVADTLEWVQALNNIGTDYRRMGVLDAALEYHYLARTLSEKCADTSFTAKKNRVVSLNGLGNIYMTMCNWESADSVLHLALEGERQLHSTIGQAINYANLGSIFYHRGQTDSALAYYGKSMELNTEAGSTLGMSLCHTYFGSIYQQEGRYGDAISEYEAAYRLMQDSKDEWHALNSLIALAGIYDTTGDDSLEMEYLARAMEVASRIKSPEHLVQINTLYYKYYKRKGDWRTALDFYEQATALQESMVNIEKVNRIQNTRLNIERGRQAQQMDEARRRLEQERSKRVVGFCILGSGLLIAVAVLALVLYSNRLRRRNHFQLKKLAALRENFFTNITHEFRTPLTVILALSRDLQQENSEKVKESARTIERQGNGLLSLINQLLDISKIKSEVGDPDYINGDITLHITMIVDIWREYAAGRNIALKLSAAEKVEMDFVPDYVNKVLNNLLSNAFKFTPENGEITVAVSRSAGLLNVDVTDTGAGMDKETLSHIFEPFYQARTDVRSVGSGVGLTLVKQIIDAVNGSIAADSRPGRGTAFHIEVPIHNNARRAAGLDTGATVLLPQDAAAPADSASEDNQRRLLVIEDNGDIAAYIGSLFEGDFAVSYASNGREGIEKALDLVPDLIITDLLMPAVDGLQLCRQVRLNQIVNHIPIIVVTAKITDEERIRVFEAGADAYIAKPFNCDELRTRAERLLERNLQLRGKSGEPDSARQIPDAQSEFLSKTEDCICYLMEQRQLNVNSLSERLCMSPRQLHRKLVAITGDAPAAYILKIKMQKAANLLESKPSLTVEDIAERCGFEHTPNFYSAFKKTYGVTPTDFRRRVAPAAKGSGK